MEEEEKKPRVLLVEDDPNLGTLLNEYLNAKNFESSLYKNGQEGFDAFVKNQYDICILDVMMPVKDGFTLAKEIRKINPEVPIIFLTAKSMKEDKIEGFNLGADDYMTKPFSMEELLMRLKAIIKRTRGKNKVAQQEVFEIGNFEFNYKLQRLRWEDGERKLTSKENELLRMLAMNLNDILDRSQALLAIWGDDSYFNSRSMDVYITKLRKYLKPDESVEIMNIHGKGFKLIVKTESEA